MRYLIVLPALLLLSGCWFIYIPAGAFSSSPPTTQPATEVTDDAMDTVWDRPGATSQQRAADFRECQMVLVPKNCMLERGYTGRKSAGPQNVRAYEAR